MVSRPIIKRRLEASPPLDDAPIATPTPAKESAKRELPLAASSSSGTPGSSVAPVPAIPKTHPKATPPLVAHRREFLAIADEDYEQIEEELVKVAKRSAPAWLISLGVHTSILVVLGILMLPGLLDQPLQIEVVYAE